MIIMAEETVKTKKNNKKGNSHLRVAALVFLFLAVVIAISVPVWSRIKRVITETPEEGHTTFNASRYFFRVDYPTEWFVNREQNGFLLDDAKGLVAEISPAAEADGDKVIDENVKISFYYRADGVTLEEASQEFLSAFKNYYPGIEFGEPDLVNIESQKTTLVAYDFTSDEGKTSGTLYVATRSMAHYAILLTHKTDYAGYNEYEEEIIKLLRTFRLTVFED